MIMCRKNQNAAANTVIAVPLFCYGLEISADDVDTILKNVDNVIAYTPAEGAEWELWFPHSDRPDGYTPPRHVHALLLDDGRIWDTVNGIRPPSEYSTQVDTIMRAQQLARFKEKEGDWEVNA